MWAYFYVWDFYNSSSYVLLLLYFFLLSTSLTIVNVFMRLSLPYNNNNNTKVTYTTTFATQCLLFFTTWERQTCIERPRPRQLPATNSVPTLCNYYEATVTNKTISNVGREGFFPSFVPTEFIKRSCEHTQVLCCSKHTHKFRLQFNILPLAFERKALKVYPHKCWVVLTKKKSKFIKLIDFLKSTNTTKRKALFKPVTEVKRISSWFTTFFPWSPLRTSIN